MRPETVRRALRNLLVMAEPAVVLFVAGLLSLLLALPFLAFSHRVTFPLLAESGVEAAPHDRLVEEIRALELAAEVEVRSSRKRGDRLVLEGVVDVEGIGVTVGGLLEDAGYRAPPFRSRRTLTESDLLRSSPRMVLSMQALVFLLAGGILIRSRLLPAADRPRAAGPTAQLLLGVAGGLAAFGISLLVSLLLRLLGVEVEEQAWVVELLRDRPRLLGLVPWLVLIVPWSEEVFFRGYVFRFVAQRVGLTAGLVYSSVLFAFAHFNPSGLLIYTGIGLVLAWIYRRGSSLTAPVLAHVIHNSLAVAVSLLAPETIG